MRQLPNYAAANSLRRTKGRYKTAVDSSPQSLTGPGDSATVVPADVDDMEGMYDGEAGYSDEGSQEIEGAEEYDETEDFADTGEEMSGDEDDEDESSEEEEEEIDAY